MSITSQMYILGGLVIAFLIIMIVCLVVWLYVWRQRNDQTRFKRLSETTVTSQTIKPAAAPDIKIDTIEFTLPSSAFARSPFQWGGEEIVCEEAIEDDSKEEVRTHVGTIVPGLYQSSEESETDTDSDLPPGNNGRVYFSLEYVAQSEKLIVNVDKIRNLLGRNLSLQPSTSCDPFIRIYLLPDEKRYLQSKMKRKTRNPVFKEMFVFTMSYSLLVERTLRITVFDVDRFMRQSIIGHVLYPLNDLDITMVTEVSRDVEKFAQLLCSSGRLQVGLTHFPGMNRVAVNIIRGLQLGEECGMPPPDTYVKATYLVLNKAQKVKKTSIQKNSFEPFYNQTFEFKVDPTGLDAACINFEVFQQLGGMKNDKSLGSFVAGGSLCSRGKEFEHWESMLQKPQVVVKEWHDLKR